MKKVHFSKEPAQIRYIIAWDFAHRAARCSDYIQCSSDRERFKNRILQLSLIIDPILLEKLKIYQTFNC